MVDSPTTTVRQRPEQARSKLRVEQVLDAARELIAERGIDPTTITAIADRAGMAVTALYRYFPNKVAIIRELAVQTFEHDGRAVVAPILSTDAPVEDLVRQGVVGYWQLNQQEPFRRNLRIAVQADAELAALDAEDNRLNAELLGRHVAGLTGCDLRAMQEVMMLTLSLLDGLIQVTTHMPEAEVPGVLDTFVQMVTGEVLRHAPTS